MCYLLFLVVDQFFKSLTIWSFVISNDGHPFAAGLTLAKLAAVTVDESGKETFVTGGALDRIQKVSLWFHLS